MKKKAKDSLADEEGGNPLVKKKKSAAYLSHYDLMEAIILRLQEEKTKDGDEIRFSFVEDTKDYSGRKQGWVLHKLEAYVEEGGYQKKVGYLKISYIPLERFQEVYPTIWHFMSHQKGWALGEALDQLDDINVLWKALFVYVGYHSRPDVPEEEKRQVIERTAQRHQEEFREFRRFHVNKPLVDFIRVDPNWRRKGIGQTLYKKGAEIMAQRGMKLHASGIQEDEAKAAWKKMGYGNKSGRRFIKT